MAGWIYVCKQKEENCSLKC